MGEGGGGDHIWVLGDGQPYQRILPASVGEFYGYSRTTNQILMAAQWGDHGAGPGNVSVSDLSILDLETGQITTLLSDNVVEAAFAPNGQDIAYILAVPTTYELHWRSPDGVDRILAIDVTFTWGISPTGEQVGFTRESGYEIDIDPGFYVVDISSGEETKLSNVDKSGTGSISDHPFWNFDGSEVILSHYGGPDEARLVWARVDGSKTHDIGLQSGSGEPWANALISYLLWDPDGEHLYAVPAISTTEGGMGGPSPLVRYRLDRTSWTLADGEQVGEVSFVLDWAVPGVSLWVLDKMGEIEEFVLP
jgi:Tol biopolymer transport system component